MELASVKGDTVVLLYHPSEGVAEVGQQFVLREMPNCENGLVVQVIANELIEYAGLEQGMIQRILERRYAHTDVLLDGESKNGGMNEVQNIKVARAKIRKRVVDGNWETWDGYVPSRNVVIEQIEAANLLPRVLPLPAVAVSDLMTFQGVPCVFDGPRFGHVCAAVGMKGQGKSHLLKLLVLALVRNGIPVIAFDLNHEYENIDGAQVLRWRENFRFRLSELGAPFLKTIMRAVQPLAPGSASDNYFEYRISEEFKIRAQACKDANQAFTIDIPYLREQFARRGSGSKNDFVRDAILDRLKCH